MQYLLCSFAFFTRQHGKLIRHVGHEHWQIDGSSQKSWFVFTLDYDLLTKVGGLNAPNCASSVRSTHLFQLDLSEVIFKSFEYLIMQRFAFHSKIAQPKRTQGTCKFERYSRNMSASNPIPIAQSTMTDREVERCYRRQEEHEKEEEE